MVTLNYAIHRDPIEDNPYNQKNLIFDRNKKDLFINELKINLLPLSSTDNIEDLYYNFTTTLSYSINKFSIEVSSNKRNRKANPWYDTDCKNARREIKEALDESLKINKIKNYKALTKKKKRQYIDKRQDNLLHLSKTAPKKFWRQILTRKTKDNIKISLHDWNSYLNKLYDSPNVIDHFETLLTMEEVFSLKDIDFWVKRLANGKAKDIEGYQAEILKIGGLVLIPHIHKLFNQPVKQGFPKPWTQNLIIPIFKSRDTNNPSNYLTIMISPLLSKLF